MKYTILTDTHSLSFAKTQICILVILIFILTNEPCGIKHFRIHIVIWVAVKNSVFNVPIVVGIYCKNTCESI